MFHQVLLPLFHLFGVRYLEKKQNDEWREDDIKTMVKTPGLQELLPGGSLTTKTTNENGWIQKVLESGTYRFGFNHFFDLNETLNEPRENCWNEEPLTAYSNEFYIN